MFQKVKKLFFGIAGKVGPRKRNELAGEKRYALLVPICLEDNEVAQYSDEFELAFNHPDAKNIALSGPYGAGKSSIAITMETNELSKGRTWAHISLANFEGVPDGRSVEDEILSQLVYKVPANSLSRSRLRPLRDGSKLGDAVRAALIVLFGLVTVFLFYEVNSGISFSFPHVSAETIFVVAMTIWCIFVGYIIYCEIRTKFITRVFKRFKFLNAEVELFEKDGDTVLDKYMDDIVYVLNNSKLDVLVFEDIDRFGNLAVFEKLRRINDLANENRRAPLRFLYLVKDSLFLDPHDRTKFFDFIIPVIPHVDPSNSINLLKRGLAVGGIRVDKSFLYQLSTFVDDPRILKEICNETLHYRDFLFPGDEILKYSPEKLVGIISYKVIFPKDYENLQIGRGYVQSLFAKKAKFVDRINEDNSRKIDEFLEEIRRIDRNLKVNEDELQLLYLSVFEEFRQWPEFAYYEGDDSTEPSELIRSIESSRGADLDNMLHRLEYGDTRYSDRLKEVRESSDTASAIYRYKIEMLKRKSSEYARMTLSDLIGECGNEIDFFTLTPSDLAREEDYDEFGIDKVMTSTYFPLIRFLISQGWLDETFPRYMSKIYPDSIFPGDLDFVNSILGAGPSRPEYRVSNCEAVLIRLDRKVLSRSGARNYSLLDWVLSSGDNEYAEAILAGVAHDRDSCFLAGFLNSDYSNSFIFSRLDEIYAEWPADIMGNEAIEDDQKMGSLRCALVADELSAAILKNSQAIGEFISLDSGFLSVPVSNPQGFVEALAQVSFSPRDIDIETCDKRVLTGVIERGMYVPDAKLVSKLFNWKYAEAIGQLPITELNDALYKEVDGVIRRRVTSDIDCYVASLVCDSRYPLRDKDDAIAMVLNTEGLSLNTCRAYIGSLEKCVSELSKIVSNDFVRLILEEGKAKATTTNLLDGYNRLGFDEGLSKFLANCGAIERIGINDEDEAAKATAQGLLESCLACDCLDVDTVERVIHSLGSSFPAVSLPIDEDSKISMAISLHAFQVTERNLKSMRSAYPELVSRFAMCDLRAYTDLVCGVDGESPLCMFVADEAVELFGKVDADLGQKMRMANALNERVSAKPSFPDEVNICLIERDLYDSFESLVSLYSQGGKLLQEVIAKEIESKPWDFLEIDLPDALEVRLLAVMKNQPRDNLVDFVARRIDALCKKDDRAKVKFIFQRASMENYVKLIDGPVAMIEATPTDDYLLGVLEDIGMCGNVAKEINGEGKRRASSRGYRRGKVAEAKA